MATFNVEVQTTPVSVNCGDAGGTVTNGASGATVYYRATLPVTATTYDGSIAVNASATLGAGQQYLVTASGRADVRVAASSVGQPAPGGPAGGDLVGAFPNPTIGAGTVDVDDLGASVSVARTPETDGAVGDGVTDDTVALLAWVATGKPLQLTPGKTYLCQQGLNLLVGQTLNGNGSTLKRTAQAVTTTNDAITSGVTTAITVAAISGGAGATAWQFKVGDRIVAEQGGTLDQTARQIQSIVGNLVTITTPFGVTLAGTINIRHGYPQLAANAANSGVINLVLDGNRANWSWARWQHTVGILSYGAADNFTIIQNDIVEQPGDALQLANGNAMRVGWNRINNIGGRGVCWAGSGTSSYGARTVFNRITNCDLDAAVAGTDGHGCVSLSSFEGDVLIHGNYLANSTQGIGSLSSADNSDITITDNEIRTMSSNAIEGNTGSGSPVVNVVIENNRIYNTSGILISSPGGTSPVTARWIVRGNVLVESIIILTNVANITVQGNICYSAGTAIRLLRLGNGGGATGIIDGLVQGNQFIGGDQGILLDANCNRVEIADNVFDGQNSQGINMSAGTDITIVDNTVSGGAASFIGIRGVGPVTIHANQVRATAGSACIAIQGAGTAAIVDRNVCNASGGPSTILVSNGTNAIVRDNVLNAALVDSGTNTTKIGNVFSVGPVSGKATLVGGTVTVNTPEVVAADRIVLSNVLAGGTLGTLSVGAIVAGTSFVINSSLAADTSTVYWEIRH